MTPPSSATNPPAPAPRPARSHALHAPLILLVCLILYWPMLGSSGFTLTEGHRVIPGWEMLENADFLRIEMFGLTYLRKPPGMPWAVAASSSLFGQTEFAARAVSAASLTATALIAFLFASTFFGRAWGLPAGLAQALMPWMWQQGRSAEIEALNLLGTQIAAFSLLAILLTHSAPHTRAARILPLTAAAGIVIAALAKGPASLPCLLGLLAGVCIATRSARALADIRLWIALALSTLILIPIAIAILRANATEDAVTEDVAGFLWRTDRIPAILALTPIAFLAAMPVSLALLFPFGPDASAEADAPAEDQPDPRQRLAAARALAWAWLCTMAVFTIVGVSNHRYALPAAVFLPPLVSYVARGCAHGPGAMTPLRRKIARWMALGHPAVLPTAMIVGGLIWAAANESWRERSSGRDAGHEIAALIEHDAEIWADEMIEARPEVLLYARRAARPAGRSLTPLWRKHHILRAQTPAPGGYMLLRTDRDHPEHARYLDRIDSGDVRRIGAGTAHKFSWALYRVEGRGPAEESTMRN